MSILYFAPPQTWTVHQGCRQVEYLYSSIEYAIFFGVFERVLKIEYCVWLILRRVLAIEYYVFVFFLRVSSIEYRAQKYESSIEYRVSIIYT